MKAAIQFIKGINENTIPLINITRSIDGTTGTATFIFENPNILYNNVGENSEITGMFLVDKEGILSTKDINAKFIQGKPTTIQAIYIIKSAEAWDRFMRFMERYSEENDLTFTRA
uniref:Photosystem II reaction center Psb28 protein n=1 Tax=Ishige okamurae TaxID=233772 RepID=A0A8E5XRQ3_9PHAE|nr:photosystem II protein W [Ishige okamurae]QVJ99663.1 photosystem II protein W [Ishige okamurae]WAM64101.1 Photosystem II reaction center protein W [Ishige okamurae]